MRIKNSIKIFVPTSDENKIYQYQRFAFIKRNCIFPIMQKNPNEETQQYQGIYVDPRTVPEIDLVQANQTFMPSFPADYGEGSNLVTITDEPYISDVPIVADDLDNTSIFQDIELPEGPPITVNLNQSYPSDNYSPAPQYGLDEAAVDAYDFITSGNTGNANSGIVQAIAQLSFALL